MMDVLSKTTFMTYVVIIEKYMQDLINLLAHIFQCLSGGYIFIF